MGVGTLRRLRHGRRPLPGIPVGVVAMPRPHHPVWLVVGAAMLASAADRLSPQHPELLQPSILQAYRSGLRRLTIPPGTYRIAPPAQGPHLQLADLSDFEIDAR